MSIGCSSIVSADDSEVQKVINITCTVGNGSQNESVGTLTIYPQDGEEQSLEKQVTPSNSTYNIIKNGYEVRNVDGSPLFYSEKRTTVKLSNIYYSYLVFNYQGGNSMKYYRVPDYITALVTYVDGSTTYIEDVKYTQEGTSLNTEIEFTPELDVKSIKFITSIDISSAEPYNYFIAYLGEVLGDGNYSFYFEQSTEEASILGWIADIFSDLWDLLVGAFDSIISTIDNIKSNLTTLLSFIRNLPKNIWGFIEDGLQSLFIPDTEFIVDYKEQMLTMLEEKFGAVYQVLELGVDYWDSLMNSVETKTINVPEATIEFGQDSFTFGGYDVAIIPEGFEWLVAIIKTVVGCISTLLFYNGLKKIYDDVMEG